VAGRSGVLGFWDGSGAAGLGAAEDFAGGNDVGPGGLHDCVAVAAGEYRPGRTEIGSFGVLAGDPYLAQFVDLGLGRAALSARAGSARPSCGRITFSVPPRGPRMKLRWRSLSTGHHA
jgi:hypothetical protein